MKKKFINSLKFGSLLGFACNNIKADYNLGLYYNIKFTGQSAIFKLKGDNNTILNNPEKCENNFLDVVKKYKGSHDVSNFEDIKNKYVPVYYYVNGDTDPKICSFVIEPGGKPELYFDGDVNKVEEVVWVKKSDKKNNVTFCSIDGIKNTIKSTRFLVDEKYIYNLFLKKGYYKSIDNIKKDYDINITSDKDGNQNIEIICKYIFKIPDSVEFKIFDKDVEGGNFITSLNKLENLYIKTADLFNLFNNDCTIKEGANIYIFEYKNKKYYIISDEKHKEEKLFEFLKTKNNLKDKDLIFDKNSEIKTEEGTGNLEPGEYKLIDKEKPKKPEEKPEEPQTDFKYRFTGDTSLSNCIGRDFVTKQKVKVQTLFKNQDTNKYVFVAIKEDTNERFINNQELEPGTYELKREEKHQDKKEQGQGEGSDQVNSSKKKCKCC